MLKTHKMCFPPIKEISRSKLLENCDALKCEFLIA